MLQEMQTHLNLDRLVLQNLQVSRRIQLGFPAFQNVRSSELENKDGFIEVYIDHKIDVQGAKSVQ